MGIFIHLAISESVTKEEWEHVYAETLQLVEQFPFAERKGVNIKGINTICLTPTKEREFIYGWNKDKKRIGWETEGDYISMKTAESYFLSKDLIEDNRINEDAGDAMLSLIPSYLNYSYDDKRFSHVYDLWGGKTQGEPYHMYLLAIACLIEHRLGNKAFVYGDITNGQCKKAVEMANKYLGEKIDIPDRCVPERFFKRVNSLNLNEEEKMKILICLYLGNKDEAFGKCVRSYFTKEFCDAYWKSRFKNCRMGTIGFEEVFHEYLLMGFDLKKLSEVINFIDEDGNSCYEKFVLRILDAKLHIKEKDCRDVLVIDQERDTPYTIWNLMTQTIFAGSRNKKVNRYIPIEEIKAILKESIGNQCDVDAIIDEYLEKEVKQEVEYKSSSHESNTDTTDAFHRIFNKTKNSIQESYEKYNIAEFEHLSSYEKNNKIAPSIKAAIINYINFSEDILKEDVFTELMDKTSHERCQWLVFQNRHLLIRDKDWKKIFDDIEKNKDSFSRYYPMVRVKADTENIQYVVKAIVLNDDLYTCFKNENLL